MNKQIQFFLKETYKRTYTTENVKLTIQFGCEVNSQTKNN